jgi:anti-sigma factor RsiW
MSCTNVIEQLDAYVDDELTAAEALAVSEHLVGCPACSKDYESLLAMRMRIHETLPRIAAPDVLRARVHDAIRRGAAADPSAATPRGAIAPRRWSMGGRTAAAVVAALLVGGLSGLAVANRGRSEPGLPEAVLTSHIRSLMADHLTDVISTDQHTVKPWFAGKLDFSPAVYSFDAQGFPLVGGRMDYVDQQEVAALVYHRRAHVINLFVWPAQTGGGGALEEQAERGYTMLHWRSHGMEHWAVSDVNAGDLRAFVSLVQAADSTAGGGR